MSNFKKIIISLLNINIYIKRVFLIVFSWYFIIYVLKLQKSNIILDYLYNLFNVNCILTNNFDNLIFTLIFSLTLLFLINKVKKIHFQKFLLKYKTSPLDIKLKNEMKRIWFENAFKYLYIYVLISILYFIPSYCLEFSFYNLDLFVSIIFFAWICIKFYSIKYLQFQTVFCDIYSKPFLKNEFTNKSMLQVIVLSMRRSFLDTVKHSSTFYQKLEHVFIGKRPPTDEDLWERRLVDRLSKEMADKNLGTHQEIQKLKDQLVLHDEILRGSKSSFLDDSAKVAAILGVGSSAFFGYQSWVSSMDLDLIKIEQMKKEDTWLLQKEALKSEVEKIKLEKEALKSEVEKSKLKIGTLTETALRQHNKYLDLEKSSSQGSNISRKSIQSSLDHDIDMIIQQCNGIPINGNCALYKAKIK